MVSLFALPRFGIETNLAQRSMSFSRIPSPFIPAQAGIQSDKLGLCM
jgi:hypothetical protein